MSRIKVCIIGPKESGKTTFLGLLLGNPFDEIYQQTFGSTYTVGKFSVHGVQTEYDIWDVAGDERYATLIPMFLRNANLFVIVADLTSDEYISDVKKFLDIAKDTANVNNPRYLVIASKNDLVEWKVADEKIKELIKFAEGINANFVDVSFKTKSNTEMLLSLYNDELVEIDADQKKKF